MLGQYGDSRQRVVVTRLAAIAGCGSRETDDGSGRGAVRDDEMVAQTWMRE